MSPSDAPESDEPYCATACFSSAICSAFTEKFCFFERSEPFTIASSFWPTWNLSGLGRVLDHALDHGADRMLLSEGRPWILLGLLEPERNAPLLAVNLEHLHVDFLAGADDLAWVDVLLRPAHLGDVDQAFDARLEL